MFMLIISEHLFRELERTLDKRYFASKLSSGQVDRFLATLRSQGELTSPSSATPQIATPPEDDLVLAVVASAQADYLITGDRQLQALRSFGPADIVSPVEFIAILDAAR